MPPLKSIILADGGKFNKAPSLCVVSEIIRGELTLSVSSWNIQAAWQACFERRPDGYLEK